VGVEVFKNELMTGGESTAIGKDNLGVRCSVEIERRRFLGRFLQVNTHIWRS